jgi:hypothetical protein
MIQSVIMDTVNGEFLSGFFLPRFHYERHLEEIARICDLRTHGQHEDQQQFLDQNTVHHNKAWFSRSHSLVSSSLASRRKCLIAVDQTKKSAKMVCNVGSSANNALR